MKDIEVFNLNRFEDARGWFLKVLNGQESFFNRLIGDTYLVCGKDSGIRGNHYHVKTDEWFTLISGRCELVLVDIETNEKRIFELEESQPCTIHVPKNVAHAFVNKAGDEFIVLAFTDQLFDKEDTIPYWVAEVD